MQTFPCWSSGLGPGELASMRGEGGEGRKDQHTWVTVITFILQDYI